MKQLSCWIWLLWKAPGMTIWSGLLNVIGKLGSMKLPNLCYTEIELKLILAYAYLAFMYISNFVICCRLQLWNYVWRWYFGLCYDIDYNIQLNSRPSFCLPSHLHKQAVGSEFCKNLKTSYREHTLSLSPMTNLRFECSFRWMLYPCKFYVLNIDDLDYSSSQNCCILGIIKKFNSNSIEMYSFEFIYNRSNKETPIISHTQICKAKITL